MKKHTLSFILIALLLTAVLTFSIGCSFPFNKCAENPSSIFYPSSAEPSPTDISVSDVSGTDTSKTDISKIDTSKTDISKTDISFDISESTEVAITDISSDTTTVTTTSTLSSDEKNAPGVYKPNYKKKYYIVVYTGSQSVAVYGKDPEGYYNRLVKCFTCSTGTEGHETRTGLYKIWRKFRWRALVGNVYGQYNSSISKDYLFHSVPYKKKSVKALDNAEYDKLGTPASHGCIRLCVRDAKWIYDNCAIDTQVNITNDSGPEGQGVPLRNPDPKFKGWDPSDKWAKNNPYFDPSYTETTATTTTTTTTATTTAATTTVTTASATTATTTAAAPSSDSDI